MSDDKNTTDDKKNHTFNPRKPRTVNNCCGTCDTCPCADEKAKIAANKKSEENKPDDE